MSRIVAPLIVSIALLGLVACGEEAKLPASAGFGPHPTLPAPHATLFPTVHIATAEPWTKGAGPTAATGFAVTAFADGLDHPRWLYVLPNGDVLVAETNAPPKPDDSSGIRGWVQGIIMKRAGADTPSANRITLLRDTNGDGIVDTRSIFIDNLNSPFGITMVGHNIYVADSDALLRFPYQDGEMKIAVQGTKIMALPAGPLNHHWTKNVIASPDGAHLYVTVGSNSNVGENGLDKEVGRAAIYEVDTATGRSRIFASGLRNPVGMDWQPQSGALWVAVNERDEIGSDLVPDYMTSVKDGGFYGWPFSYYGQHVDDRVKPQNPDMVAKAIAPDYALGSHTASLGLTFYRGDLLPAQYQGGAFIGQHGSWNRKPLSGYKVIFVPFSNGVPDGAPEDVLIGFLDGNEVAHGRPVGVVVDKAGALLVADDVGNTVWRVTAAK